MTILAFDIDGTFLALPNGKDRDRINEKIRQIIVLFRTTFKNIHIIAWSGGGANYAERIVHDQRMDHMFDGYYDKGQIEADITFDDETINLGKVNLQLKNE